MKIIRFEPQHFASLHQSLCKYLNENTYDAKAFCYVLYLANQDTFYELTGRRRFQPVCLGEFLNIVDHAPYRPYKTIVQLYCTLEVLFESVKRSFLIEQDRIYIKRVESMSLNGIDKEDEDNNGKGSEEDDDEDTGDPCEACSECEHCNYIER